MNRWPTLYLCVAEEFRYGEERARRRTRMFLAGLAGTGLLNSI